MTEIKQRLKELITSEAINSVNIEVKKDLNWYVSSYDVIIRRFNETRGNTSQEAWIERTAFVYSWLPRIPLNANFRKDVPKESHLRIEEAIQELTILEKSLHSNGVDSKDLVWNSVGTAGNNGDELELYLERAGIIMHSEFNKNTQLASITKLFHFMVPEVFPIFDQHVCRALFGTKTLNLKKYREYLKGVHAFIEAPENVELFGKVNEPPLKNKIYLIDRILFDTGKQMKAETK